MTDTLINGHNIYDRHAIMKALIKERKIDKCLVEDQAATPK
jgi:hypothetical protein